MGEVRLTGAMAGLDPDAAARARELIAGLVDDERIIAQAEGRKAARLAELAANAPATMPSDAARRTSEPRKLRA